MQALLALIMKGSEGPATDLPKALANSVKKHAPEVKEEVKCGRSSVDDLLELDKLESLV
jgi:hypothetical protein